MGRLISFLATGALTGFLSAMFQIPNFATFMLIIFWLGMGCGLRWYYGLAGAILMPLAFVVPMWILPGHDGVSGRLYPANDARSVQLFKVEGADEILEESLAAYELALADYQTSYDAGLVAEVQVPPKPRLYEANLAAVEKYNDGEVDGPYRVWPTRLGFILSVLGTMGAWMVNTITTKPFRDPGPLGAD